LDKADLWDRRSQDSYQAHPDFSYAGLRRLVADGRFDEAFEVFEARQLRDNPVGPTKVSIGRAELSLGSATSYECSLDLATATVEGSIQTAAGTHQLTAFVHRERNLVCVRVTSLPPAARLSLVPLAAMNDALTPLGHPPPQDADEGPLRILCQSIPEGPAYALVWDPCGPDYLLAIESAETSAEARRCALATWRAAADRGFEQLQAEHVGAWQRFWRVSAVHLPEERLEFLWYLGIYLLASSARRGQIPPGLQGLWAMDGVLPPWRGEYAADMNLQETFWPALASGHLDLLDSWCDLMLECLPLVQAFTRRFFGTEGTFWPAAFGPRLALIRCWYTVMYAWSHSGWLAWLVWLRWRYSLDRDWLTSTGYPLVSEVFRFYRANLQEEADGCLHVPLSTSPEYRDNTPGAWCKDPNIDLALIRRCCDWVVEMEAALGVSELTAAALEVRRRLVPYALTAGKVLCLWPGKPLDEPHRHPSHLMAIHPAMDLTTGGGPEARQIIDASLGQYFALGQYQWAGHTYAQMASFGAVVGRAEFAYDCLLQFAEYWIGPNGLHFNRDTRCTGRTLFYGAARAFTMEANCAVAAGINDMLVQGWGDILRVFPAVPAHWRDVAFRDLLAEGAFRVSAIRNEGRTVWVRIGAGVARPLRLRDPFGGAPVSVSGGVLDREGDHFVGKLAAGQEVTLCLPGTTGGVEAAITAIRRSDTSRIGLR
jgi:alpha-L-fucosidase 2